MDRTEAERQAKVATNLAKKIHALLAGHDPGVQGATLADLTATWLAGHPRIARNAVMMMHYGMVAHLAEIEAKRLKTG